MVDLSTNTMISDKPYFSRFSCYKAELLVDEREAWRKRYQYKQAMVPSQNMLYFVSAKQPPDFVRKETIRETSLNDSVEQDRRIQAFLVHRALRLLLKQKGFFQWSDFFSKEEDIATIQGKFGYSYDVFMGVKPRVFFESGYCLIVFEPASKVFAKLSASRKINTSEQVFGFCMCKNCSESDICDKDKHQVGKVLKVTKARVFMVNIEGNNIDCPVSHVSIETRKGFMAGEYAAILRRTDVSTLEEHKFVHQLVDSLKNGNLVLDLGSEIAFSWLELR